MISRRTFLAGMGAGAAFGSGLRAVPMQSDVPRGPLGFGLGQIDSTVSGWVAAGVYPGAAVIIAQAGRVLFERYYGRYRPETITHVASAGKWVAAATIAALVDEGRLHWDDQAGRLVEGLNPMMGRATLRQLLSHSAGYPDYQPADRPTDNYQTLSESVDQIRPLTPDSAPGTHFLYGGLAMQVAGRMAEIASGQAWDDIFRSRIGLRAGMRNSGFTPVSPEQGFGPMLAGGLHTTARDMMTFLNMIRNDGIANGRRILSSGAMAELQADQVRGARVPPLQYVDQARADTRTDIYGLGEWREEIDSAGHPTLVSSPGWAGTYPWLDKRTDIHGIILAKVDVPAAKKAGFNSFLTSPVLPWLARDINDDAHRTEWERGYVEGGGGRIYWEAVGAGEPLVLIHGHSFDRTMWDPQMRALSQRFRVIRYDMRGYGRSSLPDESLAFSHAGDLVMLMDALGVDKAHLVGLSLGGAVATDMLALHPQRLLSATCASGDIFDFIPGPDEPWTEEAIAARRVEIEAVRAKGVWQFKRDWLDQLTAHGGSRVETIRPHLWKMISIWSAWQPLHVEPRLLLGRAAVARLRARVPNVPVLILTPETVANVPNKLAALVPSARSVVIRDAGHVSNLEQPERFLDALFAFLQNIGVGRG